MGLAVRDLTKSYGGVTVLSGVDFAARDGEIHALLGANGAGKSTLIKCVSGAVMPDRGEIQIGDRIDRGHSPRSARRAGVAVIYQDFSVAASLNVTDNIFLGQELRSGPIVAHRKQRRVAADWIHRLGADIDPDASTDLLSGAELQLIEIIKALVSDPKVLILDEPTAALTDQEVQVLAEQCRRLRDLGLAIVYVTHRLGEVFDLADRVTVLRGGEVVLASAVAETTNAELVDTIAGRTVNTDTPDPATSMKAPLVEIEDLVSAGIGPVSASVRSGEIVGLYGLLGSGRTELLETLVGARRRVAGEVRIEGRAVRFSSPAAALDQGVGLVPSDRLRKGAFLTLSGRDNVLLPSFRRLSRARLIRNRSAEADCFASATGPLDLQPPTGVLPARGHSGGNQQKLVVGRWLATGCRLLLLDEPTQGVDVGARSDLYTALRAVARAGTAVVVASSEPDELRQLADRVIVLSRGRIVGEIAGADVDDASLLEMSQQGQEI